MKTIEMTGYVDDQHRLIAAVPDSIGPGSVRIQLIVDASAPGAVDPADEGWERAVAEEWKSSWSDPREDIYTLEDGEPVDESR